MSKTTGTVIVKRSRNGTTIRATGSAANVLFEAMVQQVAGATTSLGGAERKPSQSKGFTTNQQSRRKEKQ
ncbi:hypothetical protein [Pandoraea norimbergensis]|uniref:Uncharacterized protein n=1 Tax=Pandoraea norimbergensis TaxID=93219 RepID=A0ABN4JLW4_9BURK|nr:hypothetical protein [Pandoraea norimbergensis]ALS60700.1 hypothetical protein AT302_13870 [Pandoraea norimbergensis]ALS61959.1 hypothetical protein AT302_21435 [Pandoraea norimbergensis]